MRAFALLRTALPVLATLWTAEAQATPEFPGVVVKTLGLSSLAIDPPQGCTLCHTSDAGGTSLRTFGQLLQQYGAQPYQDQTLEAALGEVQAKEPALIDDIKAGRDPNDDPGASSIPTPEYGCTTAARGARRGPSALAVLFGLGLAVSLARRIRSAREAAHRRRP